MLLGDMQFGQGLERVRGQTSSPSSFHPPLTPAFLPHLLSLQQPGKTHSFRKSHSPSTIVFPRKIIQVRGVVFSHNLADILESSQRSSQILSEVSVIIPKFSMKLSMPLELSARVIEKCKGVMDPHPPSFSCRHLADTIAIATPPHAISV